MAKVFTYHCDDETSLIEIENAAASAPGVLFTSKGDKVIKVCSESDFTSTKGKSLWFGNLTSIHRTLFPVTLTIKSVIEVYLSSGNLVLTESGSVHNVSIQGMTCFR